MGSRVPLTEGKINSDWEKNSQQYQPGINNIVIGESGEKKTIYFKRI